MESQAVTTCVNLKIDEIERQISRPGWSLWAILGGLFTTTWMLLDLIKTTTISAIHIASISIAIYYLMVIAFQLIINRSSLTMKSEYIYIKTAKEIFSSSKRLFVFELIVSVSILLLLPHIVENVWVKNYLKIINIFQIVIYTLGLLLAMSNYPYVVNKAKNNTVISIVLNIIQYGSYCIISIKLLLPYFTEFKLFIPDFEIALLVSLILILIEGLLIVSKPNPMLNELHQLRSDIAFSIVTNEEANERMNLIILGLRVEQYVENDLKKVLGLFHVISEHQKQINSYFEILVENRTDTSQKGHITKEAAYDAICKRIDDMRNSIEKLSKAEDKLLFKIQIVENQSQIRIDYENIRNDVSHRSAEMVENTEKFRARIKNEFNQIQLDFNDEKAKS